MKSEEPLHSFPYDDIIAGQEHHYRITQDAECFVIEQDGVVVATVKNENGKWVQLSGQVLSNEVLQSICGHIEKNQKTGL
jgi:hypothetical protein